jgi:hypothetical protein
VAGLGVGIDGGEDELRGGGVVVGSHGDLGASAALDQWREEGVQFRQQLCLAVAGIWNRRAHSVVRSELVVTAPRLFLCLRSGLDVLFCTCTSFLSFGGCNVRHCSAYTTAGYSACFFNGATVRRVWLKQSLPNNMARLCSR